MAADRPLHLLTFSTLFPNAARVNHGVFVENRLRHLVASGAVRSTVVAPVPWFPSRAAWFGDWARHAAAPREEQRHGLRVLHPRYPVVPRVGMSLAPWLQYRALLPIVRALHAQDAFDAIDAHYLYPDGVAAVWIGRRLGVPVVVTVRGTDVTLIPCYAVPRRLIRGALGGAAALISVSDALRQALVALGAPPAKVTVLRNGVDTRLFRPPVDRIASRVALGLSGPTLLSVGLLIERKGHHLTIEAMRQLPDYRLLIVGEGPEQARLTGLIQQYGLRERVQLLGPRPHAELPQLYGATDALVLASSREGWANVLLESMACGTPVVASNIPGNPEVVRNASAGVIVEMNTADGFAAGVRRLFARPPARDATRAYAEQYGWEETTEGQLALFRRLSTIKSAFQYPLPET